MAMDWNVFRVLADVSHTLSKIILIWAIHSNRSAEGVSLITQGLYLLVFLSRYLFLPFFSRNNATDFHLIWNTTLKFFYIISSTYIIFLMMRVFARTREREKAWKIGATCLGGSLVLSPFIVLIFTAKSNWMFAEFSWTFSIVLESVAVLPQLLLLRQTTVPTVIDSFYLVTLGSYRGFYLLNWLVRAIHEQAWEPISVIFGLIQTALYVDFAWVYWTRQRVKLRGGTVVDSDDLDKGWLVKRLLGNRARGDDDGMDDGEQGGADPGTAGRNWGRGGISVSADVGVHDVEQGRLADPTQFEDELSDREEEAPLGKAVDHSEGMIGNGGEWRDNSRGGTS